MCEAIDFCEYYAAGAIELERPHGVDVPGEENRFEYLPRGVAAVIAPWNFPLAILTGMTTAALATGNTVVMKPAEQSAVVAAKLMEIFREVELPPGVLNYLPGPGEIVGAALVEHPDVATDRLHRLAQRGAGDQRPRGAGLGQRAMKLVKHVIAEMGGKNAIIVDDDADLDEAVAGVVKSAFGYQGQKCSACSRVIVLDAVYDTVPGAAGRGHAQSEDRPGRRSGHERFGRDRRRSRSTAFAQYIEIGRKAATVALAIDVGPLADEGFYVGPHIFAERRAPSRLAQEEIFGPVLAVLRAAISTRRFAFSTAPTTR